MRYRALTVALACLAGCSNGGVEEAVKQHLPDSGSAQLGEISYSPHKKFACVELKTKDRTGRIPGRKEAFLVKTDGKWAYAHDFSETHDECVVWINNLDRKS
jgi:hypothetical protein